MTKLIVNEEKFIELCNRELKHHPEYKEGMEIVGVPDDSTNISGYSWKGPDTMSTIVSSVVNKVKERYELRITSR